MGKQIDILYELCYSLSNEEVLKINNSFKSTENQNHKILFSAYLQIVKNKNLDLNKVLSKHPLVLKNLSRIKNYLYNFILDCNCEDNAIGVHLEVAKVRFILSKGLIKQALKHIKKFKPRAYQIEDYYSVLSMLDYELNINKLYAKGDVDVIYREKAEVLQKLSTIDYLDELAYKLTSLDESLEKGKKEKAEQLMRDYPYDTSMLKDISSKTAHHHIQAFYFQITGRPLKAISAYKAKYYLEKENPEFSKIFIKKVLASLANLTMLKLAVGDYSEFDVFLEELLMINKKYHISSKSDIGILSKSYYFINSINLNSEGGIRNDVDDIDKNLRIWIKKNETRIPKEHLIVLINSMSRLLLRDNQPKKTLSLINMILNSHRNKEYIKSYQYQFTLFSLLLSHIELKNYELLDYLSQNILVSSEKSGNYSPIFKAFVQTIKNNADEICLKNCISKSVLDAVNALFSMHDIEDNEPIYSEIKLWYISKRDNIDINQSAIAYFKKLNKEKINKAIEMQTIH